MMLAAGRRGGADGRLGGGGIGRLDEWRPDALISDIGMPGEDGYALIEKLRERGERARRATDSGHCADGLCAG